MLMNDDDPSRLYLSKSPGTDPLFINLLLLPFSITRTFPAQITKQTQKQQQQQGVTEKANRVVDCSQFEFHSFGLSATRLPHVPSINEGASLSLYSTKE